MIKSLGREQASQYGKPPAVLLQDPKYPHNVGAIVRASSCFGIGQVVFSGNRVLLELSQGARLPREERMKGYRSVDLVSYDYPFDLYSDAVFVCVELSQGVMPITTYSHPENAVYVFGPEDGSVSQAWRRHCFQFIWIPSRHALNLAAAVYITLYDRMLKSGVDMELVEDRGPVTALPGEVDR